MDSILASIVIIIIGVLYGIVLFKVLIPLLTRFKFGQSIRSEGPQSHLNKKGTPHTFSKAYLFYNHSRPETGGRSISSGEQYPASRRFTCHHTLTRSLITS